MLIPYHFFFPNTKLISVAPTLRSMPALVVGIPVLRVNARFKAVTPNALFKEKLSPGIFVLVITCKICMFFTLNAKFL